VAEIPRFFLTEWGVPCLVGSTHIEIELAMFAPVTKKGMQPAPVGRNDSLGSSTPTPTRFNAGTPGSRLFQAPLNSVDFHVDPFLPAPKRTLHAISRSTFVISRSQYPRTTRDMRNLLEQYNLGTRVQGGTLVDRLQHDSIRSARPLLLLVGQVRPDGWFQVETQADYSVGYERVLAHAEAGEHGEMYTLTVHNMYRLLVCVIAGLAGCAPVSELRDLPECVCRIAFMLQYPKHTEEQKSWYPITVLEKIWGSEVHLPRRAPQLDMNESITHLLRSALAHDRLATPVLSLLALGRVLRIIRQCNLSNTYFHGLWMQVRDMLTHDQGFSFSDDDAACISIVSSFQRLTHGATDGIELGVQKHLTTLNTIQRTQKHELRHVVPMLQSQLRDFRIWLSRVWHGIPVVAEQGTVAAELLADAEWCVELLRKPALLEESNSAVVFHQPVMLQLAKKQLVTDLSILLCRGLTIIYRSFMQGLYQLMQLQPNDPGYRGPLLYRVVSCTETEWEQAVRDTGVPGLLQRTVYACVYASNTHTFLTYVIAGELDWRVLCLCSHLLLAVQAPESMGRVRLMPLYPSVMRSFLEETDVDALYGVITRLRMWWIVTDQLPRSECNEILHNMTCLLLKYAAAYAGLDEQDKKTAGMALSCLLSYSLISGAHLTINSAPIALQGFCQLFMSSGDLRRRLLDADQRRMWTSHVINNSVSVLCPPADLARSLIAFMCRDASVDVQQLQGITRIVLHPLVALPAARRSKPVPCELWMKDLSVSTPLLQSPCDIPLSPQRNSVMNRLLQQYATEQSPKTRIVAAELLLDVLHQWECMLRGPTYQWPVTSGKLWDMPVALVENAFMEPTACLILRRRVVFDNCMSDMIRHALKGSALSTAHFNRHADTPQADAPKATSDPTKRRRTEPVAIALPAPLSADPPPESQSVPATRSHHPTPKRVAPVPNTVDLFNWQGTGTMMDSF
jgi:hypothetical protein